MSTPHKHNAVQGTPSIYDKRPKSNTHLAAWEVWGVIQGTRVREGGEKGGGWRWKGKAAGKQLILSIQLLFMMTSHIILCQCDLSCGSFEFCIGEKSQRWWRYIVKLVFWQIQGVRGGQHSRKRERYNVGRVMPCSSKWRGKDGSVFPSAVDNNKTTHDVVLFDRIYCKYVCWERCMQKKWR